MKVEQIYEAIKSYYERYGTANKPTITIGYNNWFGILKYCVHQVVGFDSHIAIESNYFLCAGCKVIWSYALTDEILTSL